LQLATNGGTTAVTIDTSQNVGIGTTTPPAYSGYTTLALNNATNGGLLDIQLGGTRIGSFQAGSSTELRMYAGASVASTFYAGGSERMRITSAGLVGIGTNNPSEQLTVSNGCVLVTGPLSALRASSLSLDYNAGQGRFIATGADASTYATVILGSATTTTFQERMRLNTNGNLVLQGGSTGASGIGVTFPATQSASSDANCLDDYEEGTWTPSGLTGFPAGGVPSSITATYTKIGNMVSVRAQFNGYNDGTSLVIGGLPFTVSGDASCSVSNSTRSFTFQRVSGTGIYCTASGTDSSTQYWFISTTYRTT
jgi:hypothetical protein